MNKEIIKMVVILSLTCLGSTDCVAQNFGAIGTLYPIQEENLLQVIYTRLEKLDLQALHQKITHQIEQQVRHPLPVKGITKTSQAREWTVDPTRLISFDIKDDKGRILVKHGTYLNPLKTVPLHATLLFFNANDAYQVDWAKTKMIQSNHLKQYKLILVNGDVSEQHAVFQRPIYFDQAGKLTQYFHITHVPAFVEQQGDVLYVSEEVVAS